MQLLVFKGSYTGTDEFNHYVPVLNGNNPANPKSAAVACLKEATVAGMWEIQNYILRFSPYKFNDGATTTGYLDPKVSSFPIYVKSASALSPALGDSNSLATTLTFFVYDSNACTGGAAVTLNAINGFLNFNNDLLPAKAANSSTGVIIDAGLAGGTCKEMTSNMEVSVSNNALLKNVGWGAAFTIAAVAVDPFPVATNITWPYT